ncbi:glycosyltransferase [uncultured Psychroserpens sp.]|uniref:glycosyltransferase n=1 Tax=uncultured Psychroserpens sp. TaxID=255436 RepID=UPI00260C161E|nr:glycosyltransferase [uncultured Psychroserpens sp.]
MSIKKLKIGVVVGEFPAASEAFIINQIHFLLKEGHEVDVLATRSVNVKLASFLNNELLDILDKTILFSKESLIPKPIISRLFKALTIFFSKGARPFRGELIRSLNVFRLGKKALGLRQFYRAYYKWYFEFKSYDVMHIHFGDNAVHLLDQIKNYSKKTVVTFHGYDVHKYDISFYKDLVALKELSFTVNTNFTRNKLLKLNFENDRITTLPVGLDTTFFKPNLDCKESTFRILFIGRLVKFKAPLLALKIMHQFVEKHNIKDAELVVIGEGEQYDVCQSYIEKHNISQIIKLLGRKNQEDIKLLMERSSVFLFPGIIDDNGRCENQGLVIQEAQAMGLPVIISDVGGMNDGLIDGETGIIVPEKNVDGFVSAIYKLYTHRAIRDEMGKAARNFVVNHYDSRILGAQLINLYTS